jgi:hypothetical protein
VSDAFYDENPGCRSIIHGKRKKMLGLSIPMDESILEQSVRIGNSERTKVWGISGQVGMNMTQHSDQHFSWQPK